MQVRIRFPPPPACVWLSAGPSAGGKPTPARALMNLTTPIDHLAIDPSGEVAAAALRDAEPAGLADARTRQRTTQLCGAAVPLAARAAERGCCATGCSCS
jgi:hypothetical protein